MVTEQSLEASRVARSLNVLQNAIRTRGFCVCRQIAPKPANYQPISKPGIVISASCRNAKKSGQVVAGVEGYQRKACTNILRSSSIWMSGFTHSAHWEIVITVWKRNPHGEVGNFEQKRRHRKYTRVSRDRRARRVAVTWPPTREVVRTPQCVTARTNTISSSYWCGYGKVNYAGAITPAVVPKVTVDRRVLTFRIRDVLVSNLAPRDRKFWKLLSFFFTYRKISILPEYGGGAGVAQWLRRCPTSRTVPGSIPGGVTGDFFRGSHQQNHVP